MSVGQGLAVGLDIGGTSIKAGAVEGTGAILAESRREQPDRDGYERLLDRCVDLATELSNDVRQDPLGVGVPGLVDVGGGLVLTSPNLPELDGRPLARDLEQRLGRPPGTVGLENDANAAAVGEGWVGAGAELPDFLLVTLGTGIGGGLILSGELVRGAGMSGEIGHVKIQSPSDPSPPTCGCGRRGCLETHASATATERRASEAGLERDLMKLTALAREAEGPERQLLDAVGFDLGLGLASTVNLLDLRAFVVGGGFSAALDMLAPGLRKGLEAGSYGDRLAGVRIERARLGARAGWIGAARVGQPVAPPR